jgi:hypothetical protein
LKSDRLSDSDVRETRRAAADKSIAAIPEDDPCAPERFPMPDKPPNNLIVSEVSVPESTVIWRYFPLNRFLDILKTHSLWFFSAVPV